MTTLNASINETSILIDHFTVQNQAEEILAEIETTKDEIHLIEERISTANNILHGLNQVIEKEQKTDEIAEKKDDQKTEKWLKTNIEAQLYLNLR